jgi:hypothetical protein
MVRRGCTEEKIATRLLIIQSDPSLQQFQAHSESEFADILAPLITKVGTILKDRIVSVVVALFCVACFFTSHACMQAYIGTTWRVDAGKKTVRYRALGRQCAEALSSRHHQKGWC